MGQVGPSLRRALAGLAAVVLALSGCTSRAHPAGATSSGTGPVPSSAPASTTTGPASPSGVAGPVPVPPAVPRFGHVVVAVFENHGYAQVIGAGQAPYLNLLAGRGALLTDAHGLTHPSQPNYLGMFAGSTYGVTDDSCPRDIGGTANLGSQLAAAGLTFAGYSEGLPSTGYRGCGGGDRYARKHNPWVDFTALPGSVNRTFADFPADYATLPAVSFVVPNLCHDMHDCPVAAGDTWAQAHLDGYARWAAGHNSLLIVTWDEDEGTGGDHIPTLFTGAHVASGSRYPREVDHYGILRTVEAACGLPGLGAAAGRQPVTGIWD